MGKLLAKLAYEKEFMAIVLTVQHWRPYLLGRHFLVHIDQHSLKHLLSQTLTTSAQQNWAAKLLGFDFDIQYKEGSTNQAAYALSRQDEDLELAAMPIPMWLDWSQLQSSIHADSALSRIIVALEQGQQGPKHYTLSHGTLFYKGSILLPKDSAWIPKLMEEFHATPGGGHLGAFRTYWQLVGSLYWLGMMQSVMKFVAACNICHRNKIENKCPMVNPKPIPTRVWEDISMDFITGLPRSDGLDCVLVVVDRLSKYCYFLGLKHPFTTKSVAAIFSKEVVRLHEMSGLIVSDHDPLFLSSFRLGSTDT